MHPAKPFPNEDFPRNWLAIVFFPLLVFGWLGFDPSYSIFNPPGTIVLLASFLIFLAFLFSVISWGGLLAEWILDEDAIETGGRLFFALIFGSIFFYFFSVSFQGVAALGGSRRFLRGLSFGIMILGPVLGIALRARPVRPRIPKFSLPLKGVLFVLAVVVFSRVLEGYQLSRQQDPYITYLVSGRFWWDQLGFSAWLRNPVFFFSSSWESLYVWGDFLYGPAPGQALDACARFAQWTNSGVAFLGIGLGTFRFTRRFTSEGWAMLAATAALSIPSLGWFVNVAKGDIGIAFWGLGGVVLYALAFDRKGSPKMAALSGIVFGAMAIGKLSNIMIVVGFGATFLYSARMRRGMAAYCLGGLAGAFPILIRSSLLTGDPFFPWFLSVFPAGHAYTGVYFLRWCEGISGGHFFDRRTLGKVLEFTRVFLFEQAAVIAGLVAWPFSRRRELLRLLLGGLVISSVGFIYFIFPNPGAEIRYFGAGHVLWAILGWALVYSAVAPRFRNGALVVAFLAVFSVSGFSIHSWKRLAKQGFSEWSSDISNISNSELKAWLHSNTVFGEKIFLIGDAEFYLLSDRKYEDFISFPDNERLVSEARSPSDLVHAMQGEGARYLVDLPKVDSVNPAAILIAPLLAESDRCIVHRVVDGGVYSLACLAE
jgi:hypothetical protein